MIKRRRILLDCDGVLANFDQACIDIINEHTGENHTIDEIKQYDVLLSLGHQELSDWFKSRVSQPGWCLNIQPFPGASEAVRRLQEIGEVVIATAPFSGPNWVLERQQWLKKHFNIDEGRVVSALCKKYVIGDALIDDSPIQCVDWHKEYPKRMTLIWDAKYNQHLVTSSTMVRACDWDSVYSKLEHHFISGSR